MQAVFETIKLIIGSVSVADIIDILIVAYLIYKIVVFVRDSRAQFLIKGVAILGLAYLLSLLLGLQMVSYIVDIIVRNGAIALIIIFQPELRNGLERVGRSKITFSSLFSRNDDAVWRSEMLSTITSVVEAMRVLQLKKMGALVVFERDVVLSDIIRTGTTVDAVPSAAVISNIFFNKAPLHDGAVIIRGNRVHSAGCILPLTQNADLGVNVGTRHRAAIGMSENSDAVVVVLSEETGNLSVTCGGEIHTYTTPAELTSELMRVLLPEDKSDDGLSDLPFFQRMGKRISRAFGGKKAKAPAEQSSDSEEVNGNE